MLMISVPSSHNTTEFIPEDLLHSIQGVPLTHSCFSILLSPCGDLLDIFKHLACSHPLLLLLEYPVTAWKENCFLDSASLAWLTEGYLLVFDQGAQKPDENNLLH